MLISKEAILLQLFKTVRGEENTFIPTGQTPIFRSLGYYDWVFMFPCQSSRTLISRYAENQRVDLERVILIPASKAELETDALLGVISFFLTDEEKINPFDIACSIEKEFQTDFHTKAFVSTSTASIALMSFYDASKYDVVDWLHMYFKLLEESCLKKRKTCGVYSFSIPLININKVKASLSSLNKHSKNFPAISFAFARKINDTGAFDTFINNLIATFSDSESSDSVKRLIEGKTNGANDYQIVAKDVSQEKFFSLFLPDAQVFYKFSQDNSILCNSPHFDASFTTFLLSTRDHNHDSTNVPLEVELTPNHDGEKQNSFLKEFPRLADGLSYYYDTFWALKRSRFTKWVYSIYSPYVKLMSHLIQDHMNWVEDAQESLKNGTIFFSAMFEMIESLLSTSSNYTKSPGFRKIEINIVPRLILSYQLILQNYAEEWNEYENKIRDIQGTSKERYHLFLLTPQTGSDLRSETLLSSLPPGKRLVKIRLPIIYAFRPTTCLPVLFHEVGHYIGVRHRNTERTSAFLTLVVQLFYKSIFEKFTRLYIDKSSDSNAKEYDFNDISSGRFGTSKQKSMFSNFAILSFEFGQILYESLSEMYEDIKNEYLKEQEEIIESLKEITDTVTILERKKRAIEYDFFSEVVPIIEETFMKCTGVEFLDEFLKCTESKFSDLKWQGFQSKAMLETLEKQLVYDYQRVLEDVLREIEQQNYLQNFIKKAESILSETASDIFMVKTLNMSCDDYLLLQFEINLAFQGEKAFMSFIANFLSNEIDNLRILAVYRVLEEKPLKMASQQYVEKYLSTIESEIVDTSAKIRLFNSFKESVKSALNMYNDIKRNIELDNSAWINEPYSASKMAEKMNPFYGVYKYADILYEDERYSSRQDSDLIKLYRQAKDEIKTESGVSQLYKFLFEIAHKFPNLRP